MKCPICNKDIKQKMYSHLLKSKDNFHNKLLQEQMDLLKDLFHNVEFNKTSNLLDFGIIIAYSSCISIFKQIYSVEECKVRANKLNGFLVSKKRKGIVFSDEHKKNLSKSRKGKEPWNKGLTINNSEKIKNLQTKRNKTMSNILKEKYKSGQMTAWLKGKCKDNDEKLKNMYNKVSKTMSQKTQSSYSISGVRKDIGHYAASTYEANIYRILQYHNSRYKREHENIKEIVYSDGNIRNYRIDIQDIDGFFGIKNAYIEVKGFFKERDRDKVNLFKEQYPNEKLILIGNGDNRDKYFWVPDIYYVELEEKYRTIIPLWEDKFKNLKTHPQLYI